jgi:CBS domain-containing protein
MARPARRARGETPSADAMPARGAADDAKPVSSIMTRSVITTRPEATLREAAELMRELHLSGLPVVDSDGDLVGLLSERDLVRGVHEATGVASPRGLLDLLLDSTPRKGPSLLEASRRRLETGHVRDVMTTKLITIGPATTVREAALLMARDAIHRLPVVDDEGGLIGIVSRQDVVNSVAGEAPAAARGAMSPKPRPGARGGVADPYADI